MLERALFLSSTSKCKSADCRPSMGRQQGSICGLFLWLSVCKTPRARTHNTGSFYPGPPRSMGHMTFALCCRLGPWCHAIYPVLHLKGRKRKARQSPTPSSHWATEKTAWNASSANVSTWNRIYSPENTPSQTMELYESCVGVRNEMPAG